MKPTAELTEAEIDAELKRIRALPDEAMDAEFNAMCERDGLDPEEVLLKTRQDQIFTAMVEEIAEVLEAQCGGLSVTK